MAAKNLPSYKRATILGIPSRIFIAAAFSVACVIVELFLNAADALTWDWWWWSARSPVPIFLFGYLHFFLVAFWVHDMEKVSSKAKAVGAIYAFDVACLLVFGAGLSWI